MDITKLKADDWRFWRFARLLTVVSLMVTASILVSSLRTEHHSVLTASPISERPLQ
jgi:hypothetical protein